MSRVNSNQTDEIRALVSVFEQTPRSWQRDTLSHQGSWQRPLLGDRNRETHVHRALIISLSAKVSPFQSSLGMLGKAAAERPCGLGAPGGSARLPQL